MFPVYRCALELLPSVGAIRRCASIDTQSLRMKYKCFFALLAAGLAFGVYQYFHPEGLSLGPGNEMVMEARTLVHEGTFGDPFRSMKTGPTATNPPLYPLFLAFCVWLYPSSTFYFITAVLAANLIANALTAALLPQVSTELWGTPASGIAAGVLSIAASQFMAGWDVNFTQLGLILFFLAAPRLVQTRGNAAGRGVLAGAALGLLFLMNQVVLLVALPWIAFLLLTRRFQPGFRPREILRFLVPFALAALLAILPWIMRNYRTWGELVTRTNLGIALYTSNNDCAEPSLAQELRSGCFVAMHPESNAVEAALMKSIGEPAYDRLRRDQALTWMRTHPRRLLQLALVRIAQFWFPVPSPPRRATYLIWIVTLMSIPGFLLMLYRRVPTAAVFGAIFLLYPLLYYFVVSEERYRLPILWLSCLTAGYLLTAIPPRHRV
jgi:hypothetical protein